MKSKVVRVIHGKKFTMLDISTDSLWTRSVVRGFGVKKGKSINCSF